MLQRHQICFLVSRPTDKLWLWEGQVFEHINMLCEYFHGNQPSKDPPVCNTLLVRGPLGPSVEPSIATDSLHSGCQYTLPFSRGTIMRTQRSSRALGLL